MPMSGDTYVAPTWSDNAPPAIDAAELNAISQTLVALQNGEISLKDAIDALTTTVSGKSSFRVTSYVGTGTSGMSGANELTFPSAPRLVVVQSGINYDGPGIYVSGSYQFMAMNVGNKNFAGNNVSVSGNSIRWYSSKGPNDQMNVSGVTYVVIAFF